MLHRFSPSLNFTVVLYRRKKMKTYTAILLCCVLVLASILPVSYAATVQEVSTADSADTENVIGSALADYLKTANDDELIPVTIEIKDDINLDDVETLAMSRANVTPAQLENYEIQACAITDAENITDQQNAALTASRKVYAERISILEDHYQSLNVGFLISMGLESANFDRIGRYTPFIRGVLLTKAQIYSLSNNTSVSYMDYTGHTPGTDLGLDANTSYSPIEDTRAIIGGNVAINEGYTGSGIRVGLVESGHPNKSQMGTDGDKITLVNGTTTSDHATMTAGIIKSLAPSCSIYTYSVQDAASQDGDSLPMAHSGNVLDGCETLISRQNVQVINISYGIQYNSTIAGYIREINILVKNTKVPIVVAAGNTDKCPNYMNHLSLAPNVISVGAVSSTGTNPAASGAFEFATYSQFIEPSGYVNKPDICAPGNVSIYSYAQYGTSFAAPHVTGTIVQMMSRNSALPGKPEAIKAAIMASAVYNGGTNMNYMPGMPVSNHEGAGVINAEVCYKIARQGYFYMHSVSSSGTYGYSVYCSDTSVPLHLAIAWLTDSDLSSKTTTITDFNVRVYKDDVLVASSTGLSNSSQSPNSNYELIHISPSVLQQFGTGTYMVRITVVGGFLGPTPCRLGIGWTPIR